MKREDPYRILGVSRTVRQTEIRRAFRALARLYHPDVNRHDRNAERRFQRITAAYRILGSRKSRQEYDTRLASGRFAPADPGTPASFRLDHESMYHSDLGHQSDFYQSGDPLTISEAAILVNRPADWLRKAIRQGRLSASRRGSRYLVRRRDVERLDQSAQR